MRLPCWGLPVSVHLSHWWLLGVGVSPGMPVFSRSPSGWGTAGSLESSPWSSTLWHYVSPSLFVFAIAVSLFFHLFVATLQVPGSISHLGLVRVRPKFSLLEQEVGDNEAALGHLCPQPLWNRSKAEAHAGWFRILLGFLWYYGLPRCLLAEIRPAASVPLGGTNPGMTVFALWYGPSPHPVLPNTQTPALLDTPTGP